MQLWTCLKALKDRRTHQQRVLVVQALQLNAERNNLSLLHNSNAVCMENGMLSHSHKSYAIQTCAADMKRFVNYSLEISGFAQALYKVVGHLVRARSARRVALGHGYC